MGLNDDGGAMFRYAQKNQNQLSARDIAPIHAVWRLFTSQYTDVTHWGGGRLT